MTHYGVIISYYNIDKYAYLQLLRNAVCMKFLIVGQEVPRSIRGGGTILFKDLGCLDSPLFINYVPVSGHIYP